jgi:hypothetical protein
MNRRLLLRSAWVAVFLVAGRSHGAELPQIPQHAGASNAVTGRPAAASGSFLSGRPAGKTEAALQLYSSLTGLTLLRPSALPEIDAGVTRTTDTNETLAAIEAALSRNGIEIERKGEAFVLVTRAGFGKSNAGAWIASLPVPASAASTNAQTAGGGSIKFPGTDLETVLAVFADLSGRNLLRHATLPPMIVRFESQRSLTREEMLYGLKVVLGLNGLAAIEDGPAFTQLVFIPDRPWGVRTDAPPRGTNETLIDPKTIPVFAPKPAGVPRVPARASVGTNGPPNWNQFNAGVTNLVWRARQKMGYKPPSPPQPLAGDLAAYYARINGLSYAPSQQYDHIRMVFHVTRPLTKAELMYGIRTTFELNDLSLVITNGGKAVVIQSNNGPGPKPRYGL